MTTTLGGVARGSRNAADFSGSVKKITATETYWITTDDPDVDNEDTVLATTGLPELASQWSVDSYASVISRRARQDPIKRSVWYVDVEYDSDIDVGSGGQGGGGGSSGSPTDLSPEIEYDYETIEHEAEKDAFSKPFTTSAGEPFPDGKIVLLEAITVLTYSRWEASSPAAVQQSYLNKVNSDPFSGANNFEVLMAGIRARLRPIIGTRLWWVTYVMKYRPSSWQIKKLDRGTWSGSIDAKVYPRDAAARGRTGLVALDGGGGVSLTGTPYELTFNPYETANFNALNF